MWGKSKIMLHGYRRLYSLHKKQDIYVDITKDAETKFDTSYYKLERLLPKEKIKKV